MRGTTTPDSAHLGPGHAGTPLLGVPAHTVRSAIWIAFAVVIVSFVSLHVLSGDAARGHLYQEAVISGALVLACAVLFGAWAHTRDIERRFWGLVLSGALFLAVGRLYETVSLAGFALEPAIPGEAVSGIFEFGAVACLLIVLTTFSRFRHASRVARVRYVVDVLSAAVIAAGALEIWVIGPWFDSLGKADAWARVVYSASPVLGALMLVGMLAAVLGTRPARWESWERLLVLAMVALSVGMILAPAAYADAMWLVSGDWGHTLFETAWLAAALLGIAAAVYRHLEEQRPWRLRPVAVLEVSYGVGATVVWPTVQILALAAISLSAAGATDEGTRMVRMGLVGWVALTIAVRALLTVADTRELASGVTTDPLTGLFNHRHLHRALAGEVATAMRYSEAMSVVALDVDDFGRTNAVVGHAAGDAVLSTIARALDRAVRTRDIVCRSGGDQFAVILPGADEETALQVAQRILSEVRTVSVPGVGSMSASAGVAALPAADGEDLLRRAESALRVAKSGGGDSVLLYDPGLVETADPEERVRLLQERADMATVRALAAAVDARDEATQDHSRNVARHAAMLAREIGLDPREVLLLEYAGLLHDVGKIGIPDAVLWQTGRYTAAEREAMQGHVLLGEEILQSTTMREILPWVRHHHERWDGTGYPDGLAGEEIPVGARILALGNAYDSMRSERRYRSALSRSAALQEIDLALGTSFDPALGERFIDAIGRSFL